MPADARDRAPGARPSRAQRQRRRRAARRRRRALAAGLAVLAAGLAAYLAAGGSKTQPPLAARSPRGVRRAAGASAGAARGSASFDYASSPEMRRLTALGLPIYCAGHRGREVALTFDDGPGPYTRLMLAKLRKHYVHATFFVVGRNIGLVPGATRSERALGAVGDHTFTHPVLTELPAAGAEAEIVRTKRALEGSSGAPVVLFRPPYGARDATIDSIARENGLLEILWTVDSRDSLGADYAQIERNVIGGLRPGAIILMHENRGQTIRAMLAIFAALERRHLHAVSVPQLLTNDPPSLAQVKRGGIACGVSAGASLAGA